MVRPASAFIGNINVDITFIVDRLPGEDEEVEAREMHVGGGGSAANTAVAFARLGGYARMIGAVGKDVLGDLSLELLRGDGVDTSRVRRVSAGTGVVVAVVVRGEKRMFACRAANVEVNRFVPEPEDFSGVSHVHAAGVQIDAFERFFKKAKELGLTTSYDPGSVAASYGLKRLARLLRYTDILLLNEKELVKLFGSFDAAKSSAAELGIRHVVIKRGASPTLYFGANGEFEVETFKPAKVADTTGAGDVFNGAFLYAFLGGLSPRDAIIVANACASYKIERVGARSAPTMRELLKYLEDRGFGDVAKRLHKINL